MFGPISLDYSGIGDVLKKQMAEPVRKVANQIADNADAAAAEYGGVIDVKSFTTDRAHSTVMFAHPAAEAIEAKHGLLTKAANAAGYEVKAKKRKRKKRSS